MPLLSDYVAFKLKYIQKFREGFISEAKQFRTHQAPRIFYPQRCALQKAPSGNDDTREWPLLVLERDGLVLGVCDGDRESARSEREREWVPQSRLKAVKWRIFPF